jgi:hypothetical protein
LKGVSANNSNLSDDQYIDVQTIVLAERIEHYLTETNRLFVDETQFAPAMTYMIGGLWSMIAHQYSDESLAKLKQLRESLLTKISTIDKLANRKTVLIEPTLNQAANTPTAVSLSSSSDSSINVVDLESEMEAFKINTELIKTKIGAQGELMKNLLDKMGVVSSIQAENKSASTLTSSTISTVVDSDKQPQAQTVSEHNSELEFNSPGTSPTSGLFDYFKKKWDARSSLHSTVTTNTNDQPEVADNIIQASSSSSTSNAQQMTSSETSTEEKINPDNQNKGTVDSGVTASEQNFYFYYNVNDYIAIDKDLALNEQVKEQLNERAVNENSGSMAASSSSSSSSSSTDSKISKIDESQKSSISNDENGVGLLSDSKRTPPLLAGAGQETAPDVVVNSTILQCPVCLVSVDSRDVAFDEYERHVGDCGGEQDGAQFVCMFCLRIYKNDEQSEYEQHVESHMVY